MNVTPAIVLVDDDEMHLVVARRAIARCQLHANVHAAVTGSEALRLLGLAPDATSAVTDVAVVMLDIGLPDISGWEVLERIRQSVRWQRLPVVLVSSSDRPEDVLRGYELGANSYLVKRHETGRPGAYLAAAARYWVELNAAPYTMHEPLHPES